MVSDFEGKQGRMRIGSKLIPEWFWIIPMSIESIKIGFEIWSEIFETCHISDSKAYHLAQIYTERSEFPIYLWGIQYNPI